MEIFARPGVEFVKLYRDLQLRYVVDADVTLGVRSVA